MKKFSVLLSLMFLFVIYSCTNKESVVSTINDKADVSSYTWIKAGSDSLFSHIRISELTWTSEDHFNFSTLLEDYKGATLYKLEKNKDGFVTKIVFQRKGGDFFGMECASLPKQYIQAQNATDIDSESGSFSRKAMPLGSGHVENEPITDQWFLESFEIGLDRIGNHHYICTHPIEVARMQRCPGSNANAAIYCAQQAAICDCDPKSTCFTGFSSSTTASGTSGSVSYSCGGC